MNLHLLFLITVIVSQQTIQLTYNTYLPYTLATSGQIQLVSNPFTQSLVEVTAPTASDGVTAQINCYLLVNNNTQVTGTNTTEVINGVISSVYFLNGNDSNIYQLVCNLISPASSAIANVAATNGIYSFAYESKVYSEGSVQYWWYYAAFYGFTALIFIVSWLICIPAWIFAMTKDNNASPDEVWGKRKVSVGLICLYYCLSLFGYALMIASPLVWRLPYAYTCCNYCPRGGGPRCTSAPSGLGAVPTAYSCFYDAISYFQYLQLTWFMILASYLLGFVLWFPFYILLLFELLKFCRLLKRQPGHTGNTTWEVTTKDLAI